MRKDFAYGIHSPYALVAAGPGPISRDLLHCYIEPVTDTVAEKADQVFLSDLQYHLEERKHS